MHPTCAELYLNTVQLQILQIVLTNRVSEWHTNGNSYMRRCIAHMNRQTKMEFRRLGSVENTDNNKSADVLLFLDVEKARE